MDSEAIRARQIRAIIEHFRTGAAETANPYFRELMQRAARELENAAAAAEAQRQHHAA